MLNRFLKYERIGFFLLVIINLIPFLLNSYFLSLDGPAHIYNSILVSELNSGENPVIESSVQFNSTWVPNWSTHAIVNFLNLFLPVDYLEKVFLILTLVLMCYAFRYFIRSLKEVSVLNSYWIFPFSYSFFLFLGFYNFLFSFIPFFFLLGFWFRHHDSLHWKKLIVFTLGFFVLYFSHLFMFMFLLLCIGITGVFIELEEKGKDYRAGFLSLVKKGAWILVSVLPFVFLTWKFLQIKPESNPNFLSNFELNEYIKDFRPVMALNTIDEGIYASVIFYVLIAFASVSLYLRIQEFQNEKKFKAADAWFFIALITLLMLFRLPDSDGWAGYYSVRTAFLFLISLAIWTTASSFHRIFHFTGLAIIIWCHFKLVSYYHVNIRALQPEIAAYYEVGEHLQKGDVVLAVNRSDNWLLGHHSNLAGLKSGALILENYELGTGYFPLVWNTNEMPNFQLAGNNQAGCFYRPSNNKNEKMMITHIFLSGNLKPTEDCQLQLDSIIEKNYTLVFSKENCYLYQIKN